MVDPTEEAYYAELKDVINKYYHLYPPQGRYYDMRNMFDKAITGIASENNTKRRMMSKDLGIDFNTFLKIERNNS